VRFAVILQGDIRDIAPTLPSESVQCIVTSPPYWGLRDYGCDGQLGLEATPEEYVANLVGIFHELRRVLRDDGTLWLNLGDTYTSGNRSTRDPGQSVLHPAQPKGTPRIKTPPGLKPKDLVGIPWRVAFALQADGWWLRQDIIWAKPNPMPESVTDRCTKSHEYIFLLTKSARYYYDNEAIKEPSSDNTHPRRPDNGWKTPGGWDTSVGNGSFHRDGREKRRKLAESGSGIKNNDSFDAAMAIMPVSRNRRSVWTIATAPYKGAHFATFPPELVQPCILAGCPAGGTVLDPFMGSGTVGQVAIETGRNWLGVELKPGYIELAWKRIREAAGQSAFPLEVA
jgi:DNA modification methylase